MGKATPLNLPSVAVVPPGCEALEVAIISFHAVLFDVAGSSDFKGAFGQIRDGTFTKYRFKLSGCLQRDLQRARCCSVALRFHSCGTVGKGVVILPSHSGRVTHRPVTVETLSKALKNAQPSTNGDATMAHPQGRHLHHLVKPFGRLGRKTTCRVLRSIQRR